MRTDHPLTAAEMDEIKALCEATHDGEVGARLEWLQAQTVHMGTDGSTARCMERLWLVARVARTAVPRLLRELEEARALLTAFMDKWAQVEPHVATAIFIAFTNRMGPYTGPTIEAELRDIRAYLTRAGAKETTQ